MMNKAKECLKDKVKEMEGSKFKMPLNNQDIKKWQEAVSDQYKLQDRAI